VTILKLRVLFESTREEAAIDFIKRNIAGTPYQGLVYIAGGYVRDEIMGRQSKDIDLVIDQDQGGIRFASWLCKKLGIYKEGSNPVVYPRFGTAMFTLRGITHMGENLHGLDIECAMPRAEENERPNDRRSIIIKKTSMRGDAFRRDLTINALFKNISTGRLHDYTGMGLADIKNKIIRTPVSPDQTYIDPKFGDALRMLRVIRFASQFGFRVEPDIINSLIRNKDALSNISKERIREEFSKMLISPNPTLAIKMLIDTGLMDYIIPQFKSLVGLEQGVYHDKDAYGHTLDVLEKTLPEIIPRLAALLHDIGKPITRQPNPRKEYEFLGHQSEGALLARKILKNLRYPNEVVDRVSKLVNRHMSLRTTRAEFPSDRTLRRFRRKVGPENIDYALNLLRADYESHPGADTELFDKIQQRFDELEEQEQAAPVPLVTGHDIIKTFGISQGPIIGSMKKYLQQLYDEDPSIDKETALIRLKEKFYPDD